MDNQITKVVQFHDTFGIGMSAEPGFPADLTRGDCMLLGYHAKVLAKMGRDLKRAAADANRQGSLGLGQMLVRVQLHVEEGAELAQAMADRNIVEALDGVTDINYVNLGTAAILGLRGLVTPAFDIVHDSNMSKLGPNGEPLISDAGRVIKGPGYWNPKGKLTMLVEGNNEQILNGSDQSIR